MLGSIFSGLFCVATFLVNVAVWLLVNLGLPLGFLLFLVAGYNSLTKGRCTSKRRMDGKTVIVTGANSGLGLYAAKDLAMRGARVIMACRSAERAEKARQEILRDTEAPEQNVIVRTLDLASLKSVRAFAEDILATETRLDVLINNAGLAYNGPRKNTEDDLEYTMACNHYGHFLLTHLLLDLLKKSTPSRIINVSSIGHIGGDVSAESLKDRQREGWVLYADAKLANIVFAQELAKRLPSGVTANSLHPGAVTTNFLQNALQTEPSYMAILNNLFTDPRVGLFKTPQEGAETTIHLAVSEEVEGITGKYFSDCKVATVWNRQARDPVIGKKFWEISEMSTGISSKLE